MLLFLLLTRPILKLLTAFNHSIKIWFVKKVRNVFTTRPLLQVRGNSLLLELGGLNNRIAADYYMAHSSIPSAIVWLHYGFFCSLSQRLRRQSLFRDKAETRQGPTLLCLFLAGLVNYILESQLLASNSATYLGVSHLIEYHCLLFYNSISVLK